VWRPGLIAAITWAVVAVTFAVIVPLDMAIKSCRAGRKLGASYWRAMVAYLREEGA
jgi:hypothetical protein